MKTSKTISSPAPMSTNMDGWATIESLKKGDYFKRKPEANETYEKDSYERSNKKWCCTAFSDFCKFIYLKKGTKVYIDI